MKYYNEYRNNTIITKLVNKIKNITSRPHNIMEICGGQTHAILKYGIAQILPENIQLLHGPGCPVCVTPVAIIDSAIQIALQQQVIFCSFGDMLRVPGSIDSLLTARAKGAQIKTVYSPLDAVKIAVNEPNKEVVFFAIGFETTAPANAMAIKMADELKLTNFSILTAQFLVPPAIESILKAATNKVQAFLAAGHVCAVMGVREYEPICQKYQVPIVVTGFEPVDILQGIYHGVKQLEQGSARVENPYSRVVQTTGNVTAQQLLQQYFTVTNQEWRGIGKIANSGLSLRNQYQHFAAEHKFRELILPTAIAVTNSACIAGEILQGNKKPTDCKAFGKSCHPEKPLGAPMVSAEGICSAYYRYKQQLQLNEGN